MISERLNALLKRWPLVTRKRFEKLRQKALSNLDILNLLHDVQMKTAGSMAAIEINAIRMAAGEFRRQNDLLKWRLMELDPEFIRGLEPEILAVVKPNVREDDDPVGDPVINITINTSPIPDDWDKFAEQMTKGFRSAVHACRNCGDLREPIVSNRTKIEYCPGCLHAKNDPRRVLGGLVEVLEVCRTMLKEGAYGNIAGVKAEGTR